jgi:hypothetical protein
MPYSIARGSPRRRRTPPRRPAARSRACASNAGTLVERVVELAEGVRQLPTAREQLEPLGERGVAALRLGERRELHRIVDDERRRVDPALDERLEQLVEHLRTAERADLFNPDALGGVPERGVAHRERVGAEGGVERGHPLDAREGRRELRHALAELGGGAHHAGGSREQRLDARHHRRVVGVRLVELEHRELGVVRAVDPLVPEVVPIS